jgi:Fur family transcriptional regulator, ferric uptake regulator
MKRMTKQRKAILDCLTMAKRPLSVEEILSEVSQHVPSLNLSTLYRNLKNLIQDKEVQSHDLPGSCTRYEIATSTHSHHFLCQMCNRLFNVDLCPKDIVSMVPADFVMHGHYITLTGVCRDCNLALET